MEVTDLTLDQMAEKCDSLKYCLEHDALEDAYGHLIDLLWALHRHELAKLAIYELLASSIQRRGK